MVARALLGNPVVVGVTFTALWVALHDGRTPVDSLKASLEGAWERRGASGSCRRCSPGRLHNQQSIWHLAAQRAPQQAAPGGGVWPTGRGRLC